jgi:hypothetical protein
VNDYLKTEQNWKRGYQNNRDVINRRLYLRRSPSQIWNQTLEISGPEYIGVTFDYFLEVEQTKIGTLCGLFKSFAFTIGSNSRS